MKSLKQFINEASINEAKAKTEGQNYLKKYSGSRRPKSVNDLSDFFIANYIGSDSTIDPLITLARAIRGSEDTIRRCIQSNCPDNKELIEYRDNLLKLQKLIEDNFKE